jgi:hypothetical protein
VRLQPQILGDCKRKAVAKNKACVWLQPYRNVICRKNSCKKQHVTAIAKKQLQKKQVKCDYGVVD